ncbi:uncharacterized protein LOC126968654 isoform X2 [Leptidea sinapis]|uniref:uncharacterized protein LOC126968654 isoform X2 n=1 Tax=Leptidea sinapis TaxID=189913 RepID=UPI0021344C00|nr:uncharacterized protein LOC126968654 isoform X2 [Leptidea sinapis]
MAYNYNFNNNVPGRAYTYPVNNVPDHSYTFHGNYPQYPPLPLPPAPPIIPYSSASVLSDQEILKKFECDIKMDVVKFKLNNITIREIKMKLLNLIKVFNETRDNLKNLTENVDNLSDSEWKLKMEDICNKKDVIGKQVNDLGGSYIELVKKYVAKRASKRLRLKRQREWRARLKIEMKKQKEEHSRKIDEYLQNIKDENNRIKQQEKAKLNADIVLKDVQKKKLDAKKLVSKLDALLKLRRARQNTAKGRGQPISDNETSVFQMNIEKLRLLWIQRLQIYDKEENDLRTQLSESEKPLINKADKDIEEALAQWKQVLFGSGFPQFDFSGDIGKFIGVRLSLPRFAQIYDAAKRYERLRHPS